MLDPLENIGLKWRRLHWLSTSCRIPFCRFPICRVHFAEIFGKMGIGNLGFGKLGNGNMGFGNLGRYLSITGERSATKINPGLGGAFILQHLPRHKISVFTASTDESSNVVALYDRHGVLRGDPYFFRSPWVRFKCIYMFMWMCVCV